MTAAGFHGWTRLTVWALQVYIHLWVLYIHNKILIKNKKGEKICIIAAGLHNLDQPEVTQCSWKDVKIQSLITYIIKKTTFDVWMLLFCIHCTTCVIKKIILDIWILLFTYIIPHVLYDHHKFTCVTMCMYYYYMRYMNGILSYACCTLTCVTTTCWHTCLQQVNVHDCNTLTCLVQVDKRDPYGTG